MNTLHPYTGQLGYKGSRHPTIFHSPLSSPSHYPKALLFVAISLPPLCFAPSLRTMGESQVCHRDRGSIAPCPLTQLTQSNNLQTLLAQVPYTATNQTRYFDRTVITFNTHLNAPGIPLSYAANPQLLEQRMVGWNEVFPADGRAKISVRFQVRLWPLLFKTLPDLRWGHRLTTSRRGISRFPSRCTPDTSSTADLRL